MLLAVVFVLALTQLEKDALVVCASLLSLKTVQSSGMCLSNTDFTCTSTGDFKNCDSRMKCLHGEATRFSGGAAEFDFNTLKVFGNLTQLYADSAYPLSLTNLRYAKCISCTIPAQFGQLSKLTNL
jgi:hypothetical protein